MTPQEAHTLALRYKNIWRGGPSTDELQRTFTRVDTPSRAHNILDQLTRAHEHPPTIAHIWRLHDDTPTVYGWEQPPDTGSVVHPRIGKQIAWQAYVAHCRSEDREPNRTWFNECLGEPSST